MYKYSSGLMSQSFWFSEFRKVVALRYYGKSWDEIKKLCFTENLLGISMEYRARRVYGYLNKRIKNIDDVLIDLFMNADYSTQKLINLIAVAKQNRLFFEFLYEVYREKVILGDIELTNSDINIFFKNKQAQNEDVASWTDGTLKRNRSVFTNFLTEAGLLTMVDKKKAITPPILDITLENYLKDKGETQILKAITGAV